MPKQTEARVSYSVGMKINVGNYQSVDIHFSEAETFNVEDLSDEQIAAFTDERRAGLQERIDARFMDKVAEVRSE